MAALAGAGGDRARRARRKWAGLPVSKELVDIGNRQGAQLVCVGAAQPGARRFPLASTTVHHTGIRSAPRSLATARWQARRSRPHRARVRRADGGTRRRSAPLPARMSNSPPRGRQGVPATDAPARTTAPFAPDPTRPRRGTRGRSPRRSPQRADRSSRRRTRAPRAAAIRTRLHRAGAHRSVPASPRGLATRSTASRSRAGSGCR